MKINDLSNLGTAYLHRLQVNFLNPEAPRKIPARIQIETSSKCNLRCLTCPNSRENDSGKFLTVNELQSILNRLPFGVEHVTLSGIGEPLLNPEFFSSIDLLAERRITCEFYTNGTLLTPQNCEAILKRRNIVSLAISCDGAEKAIYENSRVGANFERWMQSVRHLTMKKKKERPDLNISMFTVINKQNLNELGNIIRLAAELGFNGVHFLDPIPVDDFAEANVPSNIELSAINLHELFNLARSRGLSVSGWIRRDRVPPLAIVRCLQPWEYIFIRANGNIQPCCAIFGAEKAAVMGNIFREEFSDIWNGDRFNEFRRTSVKGTNSLCRVCPYY